MKKVLFFLGESMMLAALVISLFVLYHIAPVLYFVLAAGLVFIVLPRILGYDTLMKDCMKWIKKKISFKWNGERIYYNHSTVENK